MGKLKQTPAKSATGSFQKAPLVTADGQKMKTHLVYKAVRVSGKNQAVPLDQVVPPRSLAQRPKADPANERPLPLKFNKGDTDRTVSRTMLMQLSKDMGISETAVVQEALATLRNERYPWFTGYDLPTSAELKAARANMPAEPVNAKSIFD